MIPLCQTLALLPAVDTTDGGPCLMIDLDLAGRLEQNFPDDGISTLFTLPRSRVELGMSTGEFRGRVALIGARSGGLGSSTGINGEALLPELQIAEAAWMLPSLTVAAGLVDDPWVVTGNDDWGLRAAAPILSEQTGWLPRSDLGASVAYTLPGELFSAVASLTSGEGARFAERNNGKTSTGMVVLRPLSSDREKLTISLLGRDGSTGLDSARAHRAGARVTAAFEPVRIGGEVLQTWGVDSDIDRTPIGFSGWTEAALPADLSVFARYDLTLEELDEDGSGTGIIRGGLTWGSGPMDIILGGEHTRTGDDAVVVAGAESLANQTTVYLLLAIRQTGAIALSTP